MFSTFCDSEIDLEELEAHMYGQFYYSNEEHHETDARNSAAYSSSMRARGRYFQTDHRNMQGNNERTSEYGGISTPRYKEYETPLIWNSRHNLRNPTFNRRFSNHTGHSQNYNSHQQFYNRNPPIENYNQGVTNYNQEIINYNSVNVDLQAFLSNYVVQSLPQVSSQMFVPQQQPPSAPVPQKQRPQPIPSSPPPPPLITPPPPPPRTPPPPRITRNRNNFGTYKSPKFQDSRRQKKNRNKANKIKHSTLFKVHHLIHTTGTNNEDKEAKQSKTNKNSEVVYLSDESDCVTVEKEVVPVVISSDEEHSEMEDTNMEAPVQASVENEKDDDILLILETSDVDIRNEDLKEQTANTEAPPRASIEINYDNDDVLIFETSGIDIRKEDEKEEAVGTETPTRVHNNDNDDVLILETSCIESVISIDVEDSQEPIRTDETPGMHKDVFEIAESTVSNDFLDTNFRIVDTSNSVCSQQQDRVADLMDSDSNSTESNVFQENVLPKSSFSELNLDTFTNYISSKNLTSISDPTTSASLTIVDELISNSGNNLQRCSSVSSSESDYDDDREVDVETFEGPSKKPRLEYHDLKTNICGGRVESAFVVDVEGDKETELPVVVSDLLNIGNKYITLSTWEEATPKKKWKTFSDYWNDDITQFYNQDWDQDNFDMQEEQKKMSDDPNLWKISKEDEINLRSLPRRVRCHRCKDYGHQTVNCPQQRRVHCSICGGRHMDTRCPKCLCTSCGIWNIYYTTCCKMCRTAPRSICTLCSMSDHNSARCPDLWRRYHLTTRLGPLVRPKSYNLKPVRDRWCSGCGRRGHYEQECHHYYRIHGLSNIEIQSYDNVYSNYRRRIYNVEQTESSVNASVSVAVDTNESASNTNAQSIPTVVNGEVTANCPPIDLSKDKTRFYVWNIMATDANNLLSEEGVKFLKCISERKKLNIRVFVEPVHNTTRFKLSLQGPVKFGYERQAIERFCTKHVTEPNINRLTREDLKRNMQELNNPNRHLLKIAKSLWQNIRTTCRKKENSSKEQQSDLELKLLEYYVHINSILIGKFNIFDGAKHMTVLEKWQTKADAFDDEFKESYKYVFFNSVKMENYDLIIRHLFKNCKVKSSNQKTKRKKATNSNILLSEMDSEQITDMYNFMISTCEQFGWTGLIRKVERTHKDFQKNFCNIQLFTRFNKIFKHIKRISSIGKRTMHT